jgi:hypothetical protein
MINSMLPLPGLSPVSGKSVVATFDGGLLSSDGGVLMLREVEQRLRIADRFAGCIEDQRAPDQITHTLADIIRFRLLMIAAGYEDGNDANGLRVDPIFKMALDLSPSDRELCSQSTISRLENVPDARALLRAVEWRRIRSFSETESPLGGMTRASRGCVDFAHWSSPAIERPSWAKIIIASLWVVSLRDVFQKVPQGGQRSSRIFGSLET